MSPRGLPPTCILHPYITSGETVWKSMQPLPMFRSIGGRVMFICHCPGWVVEADHVTAPRGMSIVGHDSRGLNVKTRQAAPLIVSAFL